MNCYCCNKSFGIYGGNYFRINKIAKDLQGGIIYDTDGNAMITCEQAIYKVCNACYNTVNQDIINKLFSLRKENNIEEGRDK